jgi:hypothetical protein
MKNKILKFAVLFFLCFHVSLSAQISFVEKTSMMSESGRRSAIPMTISDFDGDFNDDILILSSGMRTYIEYQRSANDFEGKFIGTIGGSAAWMSIAGDLDQNGLNEVIAGGAYDGVKILKKNSEEEFELWQITNTDFFAQASNLADINNDGWLDLFVCDDDGASDIWLNDGTGMLVEADDFINFVTVPVSDNSGNYGSEWIDIDQDNDLDLYIAKCRAGVIEPTDPRRINALFINDGNNNFVEQASSFGLAIGAQSWTTNFDDLDNDGDFDAFVINHDVPYMILENQDGLFVDVTSSALVSEVTGQGLQSVIRDFDNDGWSDILIGGNRDYLLRNNGDFTFEIIEQVFGEYEAHTFAVGDLNNDGFWDVYTGHGQNINQEGLVDDALWMNEGNANEFVVISPLGDSSNTNAIGARLILYGTFGKLTRTVRSGEGYGVCHSLNQIFGIGKGNDIDSLVIQWPSGVKDLHLGIEKNQHYVAHESKCITIRPQLELNGNPIFCQGDSVTLSAPVGFTYQWSSGQISREIVVKETGNYFVLLMRDDGCINVSESVQLIVDQGDEIPEIEIVAGDTLNCLGDLVILSSDFEQTQWNDGSTNNDLEISDEGNYFFKAEGICAELFSDTLSIKFHAGELPVVENDTITKGEEAVLVSFADSTHWYETVIDQTPYFIGDSLFISGLEETTSFFAESVFPVNYGQLSVGQTERIGPSQYAGDNINGQIIFDVFEEVVIETVDVYTDTPGEREVQILDHNDELIFYKSFMLGTGMTVLNLNASLLVGTDYKLTTNAELNEQMFGFAGPRLERSKDGSAFPYTVPNLLSLKDSNYGPQYFYYFFNWKVSRPNLNCRSELKEALVVVETSTATLDAIQDRIKIYPNPFTHSFHIKYDKTIPNFIELKDINGKQVYYSNNINSENMLNTSQLSTGMYILILHYDTGSSYFKIVKE